MPGARAQGAPRRIVYFTVFGPEAGRRGVALFHEGLREQGFAEGRDYTLHYAWEEEVPKVEARMRETLKVRADVIVAITTPVALAAARATRETPIIFGTVSDPVSSGLVTSLARPGGNVTGVTNVLPALSGKLLEITLEIVPGTSRIAVMWNPDNPGKALELRELETAAKRTGIALHLLPVRSGEDIERELSGIGRYNVGALITLGETLTNTHRARIAELARALRMPSIFNFTPHVTAGGLASYSPDYLHQQRRLGALAGKVLSGAHPSSLAVEQPMKFELAVNLKTAREIGVTVPRTLLLRADQVIE